VADKKCEICGDLFLKKIKLYPNKDQYMIVLESYGIDSADDKKNWWNYLFIQKFVKEEA